MQLPAFVAFTGVDDPALIPAMQALSARYPIEWGILLDEAQTAKPLFPDADARTAFLSARGLRFAAHVCGLEARAIANAPQTATLDLSGFQRVQVNHSFEGSQPHHVENTVRFGRMRGVRTLLQCGDPFAVDMRLDWLFDISYGTGIRPSKWPKLPGGGPFCGYSGGLGPETVADVIEAIDAPLDSLYWIDMESGIRTDGWLDIAKCEAVCRAVYGKL